MLTLVKIGPLGCVELTPLLPPEEFGRVDYSGTELPVYNDG